ncbi:hypothetical protein RCL_jg7701.t1 [Rhizophagus clarus]|nr:hypothetical protein RCL_jg7701.t1 [Rhizophagus clarus]
MENNKVCITDVKLVLKEIKEIHNISTSTLHSLHNITQETVKLAVEKAEYSEGAAKMKLSSVLQSTIKKYFQPKTSTSLTSSTSFVSTSTSSLSSSSSEPGILLSRAKKVPPDVCAYCAKKGHWVDDCPQLSDNKRNLCFNCWSTEDIHKAKDCPLKFK